MPQNREPSAFERRLIESARQALEIARGEREPARMTVRELKKQRLTVSVPPAYRPERITAIRKDKLRVSQSVFARMLNVSPAAVRSWEQGQRPPAGAALRLLELAEQRPVVFKRSVGGVPSAGAKRATKESVGAPRFTGAKHATMKKSPTKKKIARHR